MGLARTKVDEGNAADALAAAAAEIRSGGDFRQVHVDALTVGAAQMRDRLGAEGKALSELVEALTARIEARNHGAAMLGDRRMLLDCAIETRVISQALFWAFRVGEGETR